MRTENLPQIVIVSDSGFLKPSLITMWGLLKHISVPGILHFWGDNLTADEWEAVARVARTNPSVELRCLKLTASELLDAKCPTEFISAAAMGRLYIPKKLSGRVLYLDGDTQVVGDVAPLFSLDMRGHPVAVVRDYVVAKWSTRGLKVNDRCQSRVVELQTLMESADVSAYFNSGVLLLDTEAIRADPGLLNAMCDVARASSFPLGDQDHLNNLFRGRVHFLNPAYNSSWSRTTKQRRHIGRLGGDAGEKAKIPNIIIHFHGPQKPWKKLRYNLWSQRTRAAWRYRYDLKQYLKNFPDLAP